MKSSSASHDKDPFSLNPQLLVNTPPLPSLNPSELSDKFSSNHQNINNLKDAKSIKNFKSKSSRKEISRDTNPNNPIESLSSLDHLPKALTDLTQNSLFNQNHSSNLLKSQLGSNLNSPNSPLSITLSPANSPTLASLYIVCGLPKDPQCWTLAQPDHLPCHLDGAVPRFWRPEILGTSISGQDIDLIPINQILNSPDLNINHDSINNSKNLNSISNLDRPLINHSLKSKLKKFTLPDSSSEFTIGKDELFKIQAKSMKLSFTREVEVIASTIQPPSTTHAFSFSLPPNSNTLPDSIGTIGQEWDLNLANSSQSISSSNPSNREKTYYGVCLKVWSHSDRARADAIRKAVEEGSKAKSTAIARAVKAAAAGKRLGARLERAARNPMGNLPTPEGLAGRPWSAVSHGSRRGSLNSSSNPNLETDTETEAFYSESEWDGPSNNLPITHLPIGTPFWLPYCLILISRFPIYDLLTDYLRINWARYHHAIGKHSQQMIKILNFPISNSNSLIKIPVGNRSNESNTCFILNLPGKKNLTFGGLDQVNFTMWPVFKSLSLSNIISIYEIGLSPMGRVVFFSKYPVMLNMAVETFRVLLELRGWRGMCQNIVHARDVKIYLEDPGPFLLGLNSQLRPIASNPPPEVMIVDLDTDTIKCPNPHPHALSRGPKRLKIERKLEEALGNFGGAKSVPVEFHEAFPGGRFRPFSAVEIKGQPSEAERLLPPSDWNWDQDKTILKFDAVMSKVPSKGISKILKKKTYRQAAVLDSSAQYVQETVRKHTIGFVNRRDLLETKIWKLNRRLAFLMAESMEWKRHFQTFQKHADLLSAESQDLKTRLENERREHRTLSGVVTEQKEKQSKLEKKLLETEQAWMAAQVELAKAHDVREELERQKAVMVSEMKFIALSGEDESMLDEIVPKIESQNSSSIQSNPTNHRVSLTSKNLRRFSAHAHLTSANQSQRSTLINSNEEPDSECNSQRQLQTPSRGCDSEMGETLSDSGTGLSEIQFDDERTLLSRNAVLETMKSIQGRLEAALRTAGQLDEEELRSYDVSGGRLGFPRSPLSRMSGESYDSKVISIQRGRRKPQNSSGQQTEGEGSNHSKTSSPMISSDSMGHLSSNPEGLGNKISNIKSNGVPLDRQRSDPRASAVSLLMPGSSIFGGDRTSCGTDLTQPSSGFSVSDHSHSKLKTVIDKDEDEDESEDEQGDDNEGSEALDSTDDGASFISAAESSNLSQNQTPASPWILQSDSNNSSPTVSFASPLIATSRVSIVGSRDDQYLGQILEGQGLTSDSKIESKDAKFPMSMLLDDDKQIRKEMNIDSHQRYIGTDQIHNRNQKSLKVIHHRAQDGKGSIITYRGSFRSNDSSSTVKTVTKRHGSIGGTTIGRQSNESNYSIPI
ncbi:hypothetical protein O181_021529 [Austropuccinia psidii MF-1]|uniref:cDENN domain-containing protein n=1 Tax=Austropuccinia psidii MF-1 TaxID=1389203 RepID=A0A9Q3CAY5_9BASI|nr:hypothetical protein [Austropuccinia psidii MF-1]